MEVGLSVLSINRAELWKHESEVNFRLTMIVEYKGEAVERSASQTSDASRETLHAETRL
jgi:hypothetical protein